MLIACANKRLLNVDILVDDCLEHFGGDAPYLGIVYDAPYNKIDDGGMLRVKSFLEVEDLISECEKEYQHNDDC